MDARLTPGADDRRSGRRLERPEDYGLISVRIRPGYDVDVVDVSTGGLLVETAYRLIPGAAVEVQLRIPGRRPEVVRGRVIRCCIARLRANAVSYRGAIAFDRELWMFDQE